MASRSWDALSGLGPASGAYGGRGSTAGAAGGGGKEGGQGKPGLRLWSAERPDHYILVLELKGADGRTLECEACQVRAAGDREARPA